MVQRETGAELKLFQRNLPILFSLFINIEFDRNLVIVRCSGPNYGPLSTKVSMDKRYAYVVKP